MYHSNAEVVFRHSYQLLFSKLLFTGKKTVKFVVLHVLYDGSIRMFFCATVKQYLAVLFLCYFNDFLKIIFSAVDQ